MKKNRIKFTINIAFVFCALNLFAQKDSLHVKNEKQQVYNYNKKFDIPLTSAAAAISIFNFTQIYSKDRSSETSILALDVNDVNKFDRGAAGNYNEKAKTTSDFFFNAAIPLPLIVFAFDDAMRQDYLRLTLLYLETMSITGVAYSTSQQLNNRLRPFTYNQDLELSSRTKGGAKNSFYSGHTALVATSTFFLARVYHDYHPESPYKYVFYGGAGLATFFTGYFRVKAGQHFPTDVIIGGTVGTAIGILVPFFHKNKLFKNEKLSLYPVTGEYHGLRLAYKF
ncbi:MAG: phosphatase PAP2 family protein [Psychroserpens sp.]|uniref:phosphatase PAP2 family protein n=1 Tax=Psychroserpens sp. TaxID=2020870 RepID=UPI0030034F42